ncbi:MAG: zinc-binding dehydrogenase, partial [Thermomicrobiales bacterium]|nr:zinc-binding dehydrogenase [Thermomicrobiales bacterium]
GYLGRSSLRHPPLVMGHEFSGEVVALDPSDEGGPIAVGQLVAVNPILPCRNCPTCAAGRYQICPNRTLIGAQRPGAFADLVAAPLTALVPLPDGTSPVLGALTEPFATALHAARLGGLTADDGVIVWGAGSIGLLAIWAALLSGAGRVVAVDTNPQRLRAAEEMGAVAAIDGGADDAVAAARAALGDVRRTVVLEAVGRTASRQAAVEAAGPGGTVVLIGLHDAETSLPINAMIRAEIALFCSYAYRPEEFRDAARILAHEPLPTTSWIATRPLTEGAASFAELIDRPGAATKIVLEP